MSGWITIAPLFCLVTSVAWAQDKVNAGSLILQDFSKRIADYDQLHRTAQTKVRALRESPSLKDIERYEHRVAHEIRELRHDSGQGSIFTPQIAEQFRHLVGQTMDGSAGARVQQSLRHAEPVRLPRLRVNGTYPEGIPLQSSPPSFLANLPKLPVSLEYRLVGRDLVLRDRGANLIVDLIPNVVP